MLYTVSAIQIIVFLFFFSLEKLYPSKNFPVVNNWHLWWLALGVFALFWLRLVFFIWVDVSARGFFEIPLGVVSQGFAFYLFYSFGNYWFHRLKHSNKYLWKYLHLLHHSPTHMNTQVAFYRHPIELFFNTIYLLILGKLVFGVSVEVVAIALAIEGCLETFHHSNIRWPHRLYWVGYIFQTPPMHLVHHEYGKHRYNYTPFLWDTVFNTVKIPKSPIKRLGFSYSSDIKKIFMVKY